MTSQAPAALVVTKEFDLQPRSGGALRTSALVKALARRFDVTIAAPSGRYEATLTPLGAPEIVRTSPKPRRSLPADVVTLVSYGTIGGARTGGAALRAAVREALARGTYAAVLLDHTTIFGIRSLLPADLPVVLSSHNVESDLMAQRVTGEHGPRRAMARLEAHLLARMERATAPDPIVVCTDDDADLLRRDRGAETVVVARNGVTPPTSCRARVRAEVLAAGAGRADEELLFTGALDWEPNIAGIRWLLASRAWHELVRERPRVTMTVAGRNPAAAFRREVEGTPGARLIADVPSMQPLLDKARLGVAPLLAGGGSRIKLLEYAASGLASVSTDVGASGLDGLPAGAITCTPCDPDAFCAAVRSVLDHGPDSLDSGVTMAVLDRYSWETTLRPAVDLIARLATPSHR